MSEASEYARKLQDGDLSRTIVAAGEAIRAINEQSNALAPMPAEHDMAADQAAILTAETGTDGEREAIRQKVSQYLLTKAVPAATRLLVRVIKDEAAPLKLRVASAKTVLDRAGFVPPKALAAEKPQRSLEDMTANELRDVLGQAERLLGDKAHIVASATQHVDQATDLIG
jgi:hypothetical protein